MPAPKETDVDPNSKDFIDRYVAVVFNRVVPGTKEVQTFVGWTWKHSATDNRFYVYVFLGSDARAVYGRDRLLVPRPDVSFPGF